MIISDIDCLMSFSRFLLHGPNTSVIGMNAVLREIGGGDVNPDAASGLKLPKDGQGFYFNLHHFIGRIGLTVSQGAVAEAKCGDACAYVVGFAIGQHFAYFIGKCSIVGIRTYVKFPNCRLQEVAMFYVAKILFSLLSAKFFYPFEHNLRPFFEIFITLNEG